MAGIILFLLTGRLPNLPNSPPVARIIGVLMPKGHLSKRSVEALKCRNKDRVFLWDDHLAGFGVCSFPSGKKVYVAQFRKDGRSRRIAIGDHGRLTADEARSEAKKLLGAVETGLDPAEQRRQARAVRTFRQIADEFMRVHVKAKRKARTYYEYDRLLQVHLLPPLGSRRIIDVCRKDVARLHTKLADRPVAANRCLMILSSIWNWAARRDEVQFIDNPAQGVERYPEQSSERYLKSLELALIGEAIREAKSVGLPYDVDENNPNAKHAPKEPSRRTVIGPHAAGALRLLIFTGARLGKFAPPMGSGGFPTRVAAVADQ